MQLSFLVIKKEKKKCNSSSPTYSLKKINTPNTTLKFIEFITKISVLNSKPPTDGQWSKEAEEN